LTARVASLAHEDDHVMLARVKTCHGGGVLYQESQALCLSHFRSANNTYCIEAATRPPSFHFKAVPLTAGYAPLPPSLTKLTIGLPSLGTQAKAAPRMQPHSSTKYRCAGSVPTRHPPPS
jgi:hypothetical protein